MGAERDEVKGKWRRLHNEELYDLYCSRNIIRVITWAGHVARVENRRNAYRVLVRRPEGKKALGRHGQRWEDNIKMGLQYVGWGHGLI